MRLASQEEQADAANAISENLNYAVTSITRQEPALYELVATESGRAFIELLIATVDSARLLIDEQLAPAYGVTPGFNAQDGD